MAKIPVYSIGLWGAFAVVSGVGTGAQAQDFVFEPRSEIGLTFSDNVNLSENDRDSDLVLRASPGVNFRGKTKRLESAVDYSVDFLTFVSDGDTDLRHNLFGLVNAELVDSTLFFAGRANIQETFIDREEGFSGSIANRSINRQVVQTYTGELRAVGRVQGVADLSLAYEFGATFSPSDDIDDPDLSVFFSDTTSHDVRATIDSGERFNNLRWQIFARLRRVFRSLDFAGDFQDDRVGVDVGYDITRQFAVEGSIGGANSDFQSAFLANDGLFWNAGFRWTPSDTFNLRARAGREGNRTTFFGELTHKLTRRIEIEGNYLDELATNNLILNNNLDTFFFNDTFGIVDGNGRTLDLLNPSFTLSDIDFRRRFARLRVNWRKKRTFIFITGDAEWRTFDDESGTARSFGGSVGYDRNLDRNTTLRTSISYRFNEFENSSRVDNFILVSASLRKQLSSNLSANLQYNYSDRISNFAGEDIRENAITIFLRGVF